MLVSITQRLWTLFPVFVAISIILALSYNAVVSDARYELPQFIEKQEAGLGDQLIESEENLTNITNTKVIKDPPVCASSVRLSQLKKSCEKMDLRFTQGSFVDSAIIDNIHKGVCVLNPKAGTKTMVEFLARSIGQSGMIRGKLSSYYRKKGMNFSKRVSPNELNQRLSTYFKYLSVRHPLQKFVSGYYEKFTGYARCARVSELLKQPSLCKDAKVVPFMAFAEAVSRELIAPDHHWSSVQYSALPCNVSYDLILKTETMTTDGPLLSRHLGLIQVTPGLVHVANKHFLDPEEGFTSSNLRKYDGMLFELQKSNPEVFQWLLDYFRPDMDMFGYGWDPDAGSSTCGIASDGRTCC